ncbi:putative histone acetyltransferase HAC-like 3 [Triticum urartu]|uniref:histone acetyltransferase n=1 Tax=Triticum urartu TaxID=4572 RepID=M7ZZD0_TRIUA|nr:putative histone acetyltransferase HAC-like 3 [Triticum urartu]
MAQALQGIQQQYAPSGLPVQKRYTKETAAQILQLDNMDSDTSPVRLVIKHKIVTYLKGREQFYNLHPRYLLAVSKSIDEQLYKDAESKIDYMDFETLEVRLNALLSRGSFGNSRYALASSASLPTSHSEQLGIEVTDSSIQNGRAVPGSVNPPLPARDISHNVLYSQGFAPTSHHEAAASFVHSSADKIKQVPESLANATAAPCVSLLPKCSPCIAGDFGGGVPTGHTKYHFPGDVHQVDSQQPSTSGSSSSVSAMCDRTANSTNNNRYSAGQVSSSMQYRECGKVLYTRSHPVEESDQSNITAGCHDLYIHDQSKIRTDIKRECGLEGCMQMDETCFCREKCSTLNTKFSYDQCSCIAADSGNCVSIREAVKGAEQTSNSTVSKPTSPTSDESSGKHHPAKRLRINSPRPVHADKTKFPKELQPAANGTYVSSETVQSETTALPTKSPSGCSLLDSNASNNMEIIRLPETGMQAEEGLCHGNGDIEMKELSCYGNGDIEMKEGLCYGNGDIEMKDSKLGSVDETSLATSLTATKKRGGSILYALSAEELRDHMKSLNQHICLWVECDKCKAWQHQICALFNPKIADEEVEYTCAKCLLKERDSGDIILPESPTVLGALELPRTKLSDHIEQRLSLRLEHERLQRARASGKDIEEVPGVEGLTVRVVSSAARVLQVQPRFRDFFKDGKYPGEFPYKSKAILLFQKNEGVDVCLFAMYVQEYGSDSPLPNRRHVYLAYIDSVKYFRPETKSASGEALRTFVYHEILIGYLDYCKKIGFVSCSIWACPSTKRDDYVLYCHPTSQKMPKSDKLRSWYQNLIKKAVKDGVVVERNTLYDFFLQPTSDRKASISAACLPYCENDFWPGEAERLLEKKDDSTSQKKEPQVGRLMRVAKRDDRKGNLEDNLEDILLVHKRFCKHCHQPIVSGKSWVCTCCKNFHLCDQPWINDLRGGAWFVPAAIFAIHVINKTVKNCTFINSNRRSNKYYQTILYRSCSSMVYDVTPATEEVAGSVSSCGNFCSLMQNIAVTGPVLFPDAGTSRHSSWTRPK